MGRDFCLGLFVYFDIPALQAVKLKEKEAAVEQRSMMERAIAAQQLLETGSSTKGAGGDSTKDVNIADVANVANVANVENVENVENDANDEDADADDEEDGDWDYYTDTDDEEGSTLNKLNTALASSLNLNQIEEIYDSGMNELIAVNSGGGGGGGSNNKRNRRRRLVEIDSGGSDSDASGDCLDEKELRTMLYSSLKPKFMMKAMAETLLNGKSRSAPGKKKKKKKKNKYDGEVHSDYLKRKSTRVQAAGKIDLKAGVSRARRRRKKSLLEKQKIQLVELEQRQQRLAAQKDGRSDGWLSPSKTLLNRDIKTPGSKPGSANSRSSLSSSSSMPKIKNGSRGTANNSSSSNNNNGTQRVPLHTLLARQSEYLEARRRKKNNRTALKLKPTAQLSDVPYYSQEQQQQHQQTVMQRQPFQQQQQQQQYTYRSAGSHSYYENPDPYNLRFVQGTVSSTKMLMEQQQQQQHQQYHRQQQMSEYSANGGHFGNSTFGNPSLSFGINGGGGVTNIALNSFPNIAFQQERQAQTELNESLQKARVSA